MCREIRYLTKMPFRGYRTVVEDGKVKQKHTKLSYKQQYKLFNALKTYDTLDLWIAGGAGAELIADAKGKLSWLREQHWYRRRDNSRLAPASSFELYRSSSGHRGGF